MIKTKYSAPKMEFNIGYGKLEPKLSIENKTIKNKKLVWLYLIISFLVVIGGIILVYLFG
jgi:cytochrome b subunit of formate dehydrogenase